MGKIIILLLQTLIEANVDVKTTDGYLLRVFCIGFTKKRQNQIKKTCYAQHAKVNAKIKRGILSNLLTRGSLWSCSSFSCDNIYTKSFLLKS